MLLNSLFAGLSLGERALGGVDVGGCLDARSVQAVAAAETAHCLALDRPGESNSVGSGCCSVDLF